jgi:hypothetical protein
MDRCLAVSNKQLVAEYESMLAVSKKQLVPENGSMLICFQQAIGGRI